MLHHKCSVAKEKTTIIILNGSLHQYIKNEFYSIELYYLFCTKFFRKYKRIVNIKHNRHQKSYTLLNKEKI